MVYILDFTPFLHIFILTHKDQASSKAIFKYYSYTINFNLNYCFSTLVVVTNQELFSSSERCWACCKRYVIMYLSLYARIQNIPSSKAVGGGGEGSRNLDFKSSTYFTERQRTEHP